jgi:hypothetical protein
VKSRANDKFWRCYKCLPVSVRTLARKNYRLWRQNPRHPSLQFKKTAEDAWSVRIGDHYRAMATVEKGVMIWFWIGTHEEYNKMVGR